MISNSAIRGVEWASLLSELVLAHFHSSPSFLSFIFPRVDVKGLGCHVSPRQFGCQLKMWSQSWMLRDAGIFVGGTWTLQSPWQAARMLSVCLSVWERESGFYIPLPSCLQGISVTLRLPPGHRGANIGSSRGHLTRRLLCHPAGLNGHLYPLQFSRTGKVQYQSAALTA